MNALPEISRMPFVARSIRKLSTGPIKEERTASFSTSDETIDFHLQHAFLAMLERLCCGAVVLTGSGAVIAANHVAKQLLLDGGTHVWRGREDLNSRLTSALANCNLRPKVRNGNWVKVETTDGKNVGIYSMPFDSEPGLSPISVVVIFDFSINPTPRHHVLKSLFGLTDSESAVACAIAQGVSPVDIARLHACSLATIRTQLHQIRLKTCTTRSSQLVALMARVALLP